ncbi:MAG: PorV/PorQ family protein [candidate division KSB1 bacterium]|nr:PorV/PorQ family protein [candidate division KSB1 bacterium]MDZ7294050.1 PorV/PorQ family protein [candidate division KSB1 bacterium]MDZ7378269.1 PorV/PorQ family protein [candidate division KSB1 bacterium]MDZ7384602.1 PorV/PorQ family protein [candidate division KSB1 bacterium]MDZ7392946.1 PorV/PorQ family protein [candidate division KSB1 bacterium]
MERRMVSLLTVLLVVALSVMTGAAADKKLAQTGFQFLSVPTEARAAAMGEAFTTVAGYSGSMLYNPANMARVNSLVDISISQNKWIADINHMSGTIAVNPWRGEYGVLGFSILAVDYGEFLGTMVDPTTEKGYIDTETFTPSAFAAGVAYARSLTDRFSVGGHVRYCYQKLGTSTLPVGDVSAGVTEKVENFQDVLAFDFGTLYRTGFRTLAFGMSVRNFSKEIKFQKEGFQLPLTFRIGVSMELLELVLGKNDMHSLLLSVDASHPRDYPEQLSIGAEYTFMGMLALRGGYTTGYRHTEKEKGEYGNPDRGLSFGFGVQKLFGDRLIALDYAYIPFGVFDAVQMMSFRLAL